MIRRWILETTWALPIFRLAIAAALGLALAGPALALTCPAPQPLTRPGVLRETPTQITVASTLLATGDDANRIAVLTAHQGSSLPDHCMNRLGLAKRNIGVTSSALL